MGEIKGENILVDFDLSLVKIGMQLKIGEVVLEITQNCTNNGNHLSKIDERVPALLQSDRGIFAKAILGGVIKKQDNIIYIKE